MARHFEAVAVAVLVAGCGGTSEAVTASNVSADPVTGTSGTRGLQEILEELGAGLAAQASSMADWTHLVEAQAQLIEELQSEVAALKARGARLTAAETGVADNAAEIAAGDKDVRALTKELAGVSTSVSLNTECPDGAARAGPICVDVEPGMANSGYLAQSQCIIKRGRMCELMDYRYACTWVMGQEPGPHWAGEVDTPERPFVFVEFDSECNPLLSQAANGDAKSYRCCYDRLAPVE